MKKSRFTETQVISILKEYDGGMKAEDVCRRHGISTATLSDWRKKYAGMERTRGSSACMRISALTTNCSRRSSNPPDAD